MSESAPNEPDGATPISHLLFRPIEVFNQLPVKYRWEFTRRHPYYLEFWRPAREFREQPSDDQAMRFAQEAGLPYSFRGLRHLERFAAQSER
jgi:hypothetical protein